MANDLMVIADVRNELREKLRSAIETRIAFDSENNKQFAAKRADQLAKCFSVTFDATKTRIVSVETSDKTLDAFAAYGMNDFAFIFNQKRENAMMNIYALQKLAKMLRSTTSQINVLDEYSDVTLRNVKSQRMLIERGALVWSSAYAESSFDGLAREDVNMARIKYFKKNKCSHSTSGTQTSSTFRALEALNVASVIQRGDHTALKHIDYDHKIFDAIKY